MRHIAVGARRSRATKRKSNATRPTTGLLSKRLNPILKWVPLSLGQTLSTFHYTLLDKCRALLSVVERGWPNALDFSLDLELNIPRMYYLMNNSFMECFVHYLMNSNCACVRSTTLDNFPLDHTSLDNKQSFWLHSTRWPNALDISPNMHVERCIAKSRERLARALKSILQRMYFLY